ncbi:MAG TPA: catalase family peroxidase [Burkholderiaceae bacterium]|jgi:catalase
MSLTTYFRRSAGLFLVSGLSLAVQAQTAPVAPNQVVDSLIGTFGNHPGMRKNHAKGTCASGEFVGTPEAAKYSRSLLFSGKPVPLVARFSLAGGNPELADSAHNSRGMALEFRLPDGNRQHITMLNTPVFGAAHPDTFNDMIVAAKPDPATGKADPAKLKAFFATHPDAMAQANFLQTHNPPAEYFTSAFYGIHTFKFVDAKKAEHLVKWRFVPHDGEKSLSDTELKAASHDFLERDLIARTEKGTAQWDMIVTIGKPGDPQDNPTVLWPEDREHFKAGTLTISHAAPQAGAECEKINFDPLVMADGIAPTNDPILLFRSPAYAISFGKRLSGN